MQVTVRVVGTELPGTRKNHLIDLEDGATVETALEKVPSVLTTETIHDLLSKKNVYLLNNKRARPSDLLSDGDHIHVLKTLGGG